jgi:3-isopropylmalate/(R)-2-methylmalate dehydratase small subunit
VRAVAEAGEAEIDLDAQQVRAGGRAFHFDIDADVKHRLLNGLDDIALTLQQSGAIDAYERRREAAGPLPPVTTAL